MRLPFGPIRKQWSRHPERLFIVDGIGALVTSGTLLGVARWYPIAFGLPTDILVVLGRIAVVFAVYSITCFVVRPRRARLLLRLIALANLSYCVLTLWAVVRHGAVMTPLGVAYFFMETVIVVGLSYVELTLQPVLKR